LDKETYSKHLANLWRKRMEAENEASQKYWSSLIKKLRFEFESGII